MMFKDTKYSLAIFLKIILFFFYLDASAAGSMCVGGGEGARGEGSVLVTPGVCVSEVIVFL